MKLVAVEFFHGFIPIPLNGAAFPDLDSLRKPPRFSLKGLLYGDR
jgi:hypothetical protein